MKKIVYIFAVIGSLQGLSAQIYQQAFSSGGINTVNITNFRQAGQFINDNNALPSNLQGSPLYSEGFSSASITLDGTDQAPVDAFVSYDVYNKVMFLSEKSDGKEPITLSQARNIVIEFDNRKFQFIDFTLNGTEGSNYVELMANLDGGYILGAVLTKSIFQDTTPASSYSSAKPPVMKTNKQFMIIDKDGVAVELENSKKGATKFIEEKYQDQIKEYIKSNKIKFENDNKGLIAVAKYYLSIKK